MSDFKEFTGKDIDEAIDLACKQFDVPRNKLEIEILTGGSTGIFGLVGVKKATVRARLRSEAGSGADKEKPKKGESAQAAPEKPAEPEKEPREKPKQEPKEETAGEKEKPAPKGRSRSRGRRKPKQQDPGARQASKEQQDKDQQQKQQPAGPEKQAGEQEEKPQKNGKPSGRRRNNRRKPAKSHEAEAPRGANNHRKSAGNGKPAEKPEKPMDPEEARQAKELVLDVVKRLIEPIVPEPELTAEIEPGRVKVLIDDEENAGLIIGAEGQTISSLQYLANRIVARKVKGNVRVHLDAGDYREKQDDSLRQLAWSLAEKAKDHGKTQATRPLSSYHRRVVHMALQEDDTVQTRSKGDGPLKRVLILPRRGPNG
jgi:spoIIIJ-associated protein